MAWTAPRTWVVGEVVTAALLNAHLRDNLLETGPAKVTTAGDTLYATAANALARLAPGSAFQTYRMNAAATAPGWATPAAVRVYNSTGINCSDSVWTSMTFDSERYDTESIHSTSANTNRLTAQTPGKYVISGNFRFAFNSTGARAMRILFNATQIAAVSMQTITDATFQAPYLSATTQYALSSGDYVEMQAWQNSGGILGVSADPNISPEFAMSWVSP